MILIYLTFLVNKKAKKIENTNRFKIRKISTKNKVLS